MRILLISSFNNPQPSAAWERMKSFSENWFAKGHHISVLGTFNLNKRENRGYSDRKGIHFFNTIPITSIYGRRRNPIILAFNLILSFIVSFLFILTQQPTFVLVSVPTGDVGLGAMLACIFVKCPFIVDYRDEWEDYGLMTTRMNIMRNIYEIFKKFATLLYSKSLIISAVTHGVGHSLRRRGMMNVTIISNGANLQVFKPIKREKPPDTFSLIYTGQIGKYYQLDIFLKAMKYLIEKGITSIEFSIAGWGDVERIKRLIKYLDLTGKVKYLGVIEDKVKLSNKIARSSVGVIPFDDNPLWKNAIPAKFFEYCACGIPIIATISEDSTMANLIREYKIGFTTPSGNEILLASLLEKLYNNPEAAIVFGENARILVETQYNRKNIASDFIDLISKKLSL